MDLSELPTQDRPNLEQSSLWPPLRGRSIFHLGPHLILIVPKIRLVEDIILRLMIAANKETNAQAFCDAVSVKTQKSPPEKTAFCDKLTTRLEKPQAS